MSTIALPSVGSTSAGSEATPELGLVLQFDDCDTPADAVDALFLREFVSGRQPWSRTVRLVKLRSGASLVPDDAEVVRTATSSRSRARLAVGPGYTLRAVTWKGRGGELSVTAVTEARLDEIVDRLVATCAEKVRDPRTSIGFWHNGSRRGPQRDVRRLSAVRWPAIRDNYAPPVARAFDALVAVTPETVSGHLVLLHGPPGTGKTTALRALAHAWRRWCQVDCVLDPDVLFADTGYLNEVAVGEEDGDERRRWRLLVIEDCDELIRGQAKQATGQALARLLNLTDGLLGQGRDVLVAITTNEDVAALHPAVTRPGRCLARIEVGRLASGETLAERYARAAGEPVAGPPVEIVGTGGYL